MTSNAPQINEETIAVYAWLHAERDWEERERALAAYAPREDESA